MRKQMEQIVAERGGESLKCPLSLWYSLYSDLSLLLKREESGQEKVAMM